MTRTLLCFDYGKKRIGIAVGQTLTCTASPVGIIQVSKGIPDWNEISRYLSEWTPDALVVGKPLNMDGTGQAMTTASNRFSDELANRFRIPVYRVDERLSSFEAGQRLKGSRNIDAVAAQAMLETWLTENSDTLRKNGTLGGHQESQNRKL